MNIEKVVMKSSKLDCRNMVGDDGQFCQNDLPNGPIERRIKTPIQFYGVFSQSPMFGE